MARIVTARGRVQGVGFRPAVARLAESLGLAGSVRNTGGGVQIVVEGPEPSVATFVAQLPHRLPALAELRSTEVVATPTAGRHLFAVERDASDDACGARPLRTVVPVDLRLCELCRSDIESLSNRRFGYPFASCTACGPRYSIIRSMPYERTATSMSVFASCPTCRVEEESIADRRFHVQTNACGNCGPQVWLSSGDAQVAVRGVGAIEAAVREIRAGRIVAIRGLGGYQLLADATNAAAVNRLRAAKCRPDKPLAVLVPALDVARQCGLLRPIEERALAGPAGPIVIVPQLAASPLATAVSGRFHTVGLMLPTTPLHALLAARLGPCVATSGNGEGEPLAYEPSRAERDLAGVADAWLHHDRPIERPVDDSVIRSMADQVTTLRLARGLAPLVLPVEQIPGVKACEPMVAVGGHQKSAFAIWNGQQAVLGPHLGDLDSIAARERFAEQLASVCGLYGVDAPMLVCDLHPDYFPTRWSFAHSPAGCAPIGVQHHHAHIAATMLEHGWLDRPVLGVAWDGTGYSLDGTVWGGEFLECSAVECLRRARLRPLLLPGGPMAIRQPWRTTAWLLRESCRDGHRTMRDWLGDDRARQVDAYGDGAWPGVWTSSVGRLFDAVAVLVLGTDAFPAGEVTFEGQAAMLLEDVAWSDGACVDTDELAYPLPLVEQDDEPSAPCELDWRPLIRAILVDHRLGVAPAVMARRFHAALVESVLAVSARFPQLPIVLGGGVFQNRWLVERLIEACATRRRSLAVPAAIPPNDGGLAAGQLVVALARRRSELACV